MISTSHPPADPRVRAWLEVREGLERQLGPLGEAAIRALAPAAGERMLDVGCGIGGTPQALAAAVGPAGQVVGLDLLADAVAVMQRDPDVPANVSFVCGDAMAAPLAEGAFDGVFSRFGLAFFDDAGGGFAALRRRLRRGGRIGFVAWRTYEENALDRLPLEAAADHLPADLVRQAERGPWFSLATREALAAALEQGGFTDFDIRPHDTPVTCGSLDATLEVCRRVGALGSILRQRPDLADRALAAVADALGARDEPGGPRLTAATWVVTARAP